MKTSLLALIAILVPVNGFAIERPGPVVLENDVTVCSDPYDHIRAIEFVKHDPMAWVRFRKETTVDGRCYDIPAGRKVFAVERVRYPDSMECLRVEGETSCAWGFPMVELQLREKLPTR